MCGLAGLDDATAQGMWPLKYFLSDLWELFYGSTLCRRNGTGSGLGRDTVVQFANEGFQVSLRLSLSASLGKLVYQEPGVL